MSVISLTEQQVKDLLEWPLVCDAVEEALRSICEFRVNENQPAAVQPTRIFTPTEKGIDYLFVRFPNNFVIQLKKGRSRTSMLAKVIEEHKN